MIRAMLRDIRETYEQALQEKTGWGKDEVIRHYDEIVADVIAKHLELQRGPSGD